MTNPTGPILGFEVETQKAKWTTAFINNLPDAAFALILPGGSKDDSGKTTPRNLRVLPHHDGSVSNGSEKGSVDLPHLRNAMARLDQTDLTADQKAKALAHLDAHAKQLKVGQYSEKNCKTKKTTTVEKDFWTGVI